MTCEGACVINTAQQTTFHQSVKETPRMADYSQSISPKKQGVILKQRYYTPNDVDLPRNIGTNATTHNPISLVHPLPYGQAIKSQRAVTLDGFFLLEATTMGFPDDVRQAILADKGLVTVVEDDLAYFTGLQYLDVSENSLALKSFEVLPRLIELRMSCNGIVEIGQIAGFPKLMYLDLSYNSLSMSSISKLSAMPHLRELDMCGNNLRSVPHELCLCSQLEKLTLDNNKLDDNNIFITFGHLPRLRQLSVAYNFLWKIPQEACASCSSYKLLDLLDVSFNYFSGESDLKPMLAAQRLSSLLLYGNPVLGPTGEDPLRIYIEDLCNEAEASRLGSKHPALDIITEVPRNRVKKGQHMGRQTLYRDFSVVEVDSRATQKLTCEWREEGNRTLFAEAMAVMGRHKHTEGPDLTFLTAAGLDSAEEGLAATQDGVVDRVMGRVARDVGLTSCAELLYFRDRAELPTALIQQEDSDQAGRPEDRLPGDLMRTRSLGQPQTLATHPIAVKTAMRALQFAIKNPLTNYDEVPGKGFLAPRDYVRPTVASTNYRVHKKESSLVLKEPLPHAIVASSQYQEALQLKKGRSLAEPFSAKFARTLAQQNTLQKIEEVLDSLNANTDDLASRPSGGNGPVNNKESIALMKSFAKPNNTVQGLVNMVKEVVADF